MCTIAQMAFLAVFAAAQGDTAFLLKGEFLRCEVATLMGAVAEGLAGTFAAGTKPVIASLQFKGDR